MTVAGPTRRAGRCTAQAGGRSHTQCSFLHDSRQQSPANRGHISHTHTLKFKRDSKGDRRQGTPIAVAGDGSQAKDLVIARNELVVLWLTQHVEEAADVLQVCS